ncbi:hypothetical protein [Bradyrhizobium arachidis]|uniref:hypothetical protein n=1 Tax=Bradyrhizobium arachidis TaxID=858423 RepID=UPI002161BC24|nr:hypothetical protein [Bradyrhizobium arachidis]UVO27049.1 hypothetical protein KUF59_31625 [Bradyrhizobium arachidis]
MPKSKHSAERSPGPLKIGLATLPHKVSSQRADDLAHFGRRRSSCRCHLSGLKQIFSYHGFIRSLLAERPNLSLDRSVARRFGSLDAIQRSQHFSRMAQLRSVKLHFGRVGIEQYDLPPLCP